MDQDAFRKLLATPSAKVARQQRPSGQLKSKTTGTLAGADDSRTAFKPRKVKGSGEGPYRDRAAERRLGVAGDFAEVEAVLETFERQNADKDQAEIEEKRKYLGGDASHSVLVKGLDFALLEQTKAKLASEDAQEDEEALEELFETVAKPEEDGLRTITAMASTGKKRTREEIIKELKEKRMKVDAEATTEADAITEKKNDGKFKPIGFKPIGAPDKKPIAEKKKKKKAKAAAGKKGDNAVRDGAAKDTGSPLSAPPQPVAGPSTPPAPTISLPETVPDAMDEDFDIFAGAGEYEGIELDEDESEGELPSQPVSAAKQMPDEDAGATTRRNWFGDEPEPGEALNESPSSPQRKDPEIGTGKGKQRDASTPRSPSGLVRGQSRSPSPDAPVRLAPLTSSVVPSIKDMLAADTALEKEEKRKARKEKKGGGGPKDAEARLNQDYQRLKSYTEKRGGGPGS